MGDDESRLKALIQKEMDIRNTLASGQIWVDYDEGVFTLYESFYTQGIDSSLDPYSAFFGDGKKIKIVKVPI